MKINIIIGVRVRYNQAQTGSVQSGQILTIKPCMMMNSFGSYLEF